MRLCKSKTITWGHAQLVGGVIAFVSVDPAWVYGRLHLTGGGAATTSTVLVNL